MEKVTIHASNISPVGKGGQKRVYSCDLSVHLAAGGQNKAIEVIRVDKKIRTKAAHGLTCVWMGRPVWYGDEPSEFCIEKFLKLYRTDKHKAVTALDGMFGMAIVDSRSSSIDLIVDHIGSYKFFWVSTQDGFFASTSLTSLMQNTPRSEFDVNMSQCMRFLLTGISYGGESYLQSVSQTTNGELLSWSASTGAVTRTQWWEFSFNQIDKGTHEELDRLVRAEVRKLTRGDPDIALAGTGGNDSKLIAYYLSDLGIKPAVVFTWCDVDLPRSDPRLAKRISKAFGWKHTVVKLNKERFGNNIDGWLETSSLQSDNMGNFAITQSEINSSVGADNAVILGDEIFGPGSWYSNTGDAVRAYLKSPWPILPRNLSRVLTPESKGIFQQFYKEDIERLLTGQGSPKNVNHFINFKLGVCGWLAAAGFYKYPYYRVLRPFLQRSVLELVSSWSESARADKVYPILILRKFEGKFKSYPRATTNSLPDWAQLIRNNPGVRGFIGSEVAEILSDQSPLSPLFDPRELELLCAEVLTDPPAIKRRGMVAALAVSGRRWLNGLPGLRVVARPIEKLVRSKTSGTDKTNNIKVIIRICLLNRYLRILSNRAT